MENIRKRVDVRLVTDQKKLTKLVSKPAYVSSKIFDEDLVAVHKIKETLTLNRLAYIGMCILDLSKTLMYNFHYNYINKKNMEKVLSYFLPTQIVYVTKLRPVMRIKIFMLTKTNSILAIIRKIPNFTTKQTRK